MKTISASGQFPANYTKNMAANGEEMPAGREQQNLEVIVREVLNHPSFHNALRSNQNPASSLRQSESPRPAVPEQPSTSSSTETASTPRTPRQELQQLFFRGRANSLPQFQQRVTWVLGREPQLSRTTEIIAQQLLEERAKEMTKEKE